MNFAQLTCVSFFSKQTGYDLFISITGGFVSVLGAFYVYIISLNQVRRDRLIYFVGLLDSVIPSGIKQAEYCQELSEKVKKSPWIFPLLQFEANNDLKRISERIEQEGIYHALLQKYGRTKTNYTSFRNIYAKIDYLDLMIDELRSFNSSAQKAMWERKRLYAENFRSIKVLIERIIIDAKYTNSQNYSHIPVRLDDILQRFYQNSPSDKENIRETYLYVVWPVQLFILTNNQQTDELTSLLQLVMEGINQYKGIETAALHNAKDFIQFQNALSNTSQDLLTLTTYIKSDFPIEEISLFRKLNPFRM
ncbi:hypothetical protein LX64_04997 [Chitinophaga skermanii]|uniref:Phage abortive infection protein n=2 Tax=Chitinophaga skermanii TaxID=331697 RepID=A0A327Q0Y2_9BACT|nr:hypothetical protein LX64_04997 [Chitinophaga skermanii]